ADERVVEEEVQVVGPPVVLDVLARDDGARPLVGEEVEHAAVDEVLAGEERQEPREEEPARVGRGAAREGQRGRRHERHPLGDHPPVREPREDAARRATALGHRPASACAPLRVSAVETCLLAGGGAPSEKAKGGLQKSNQSTRRTISAGVARVARNPGRKTAASAQPHVMRRITGITMYEYAKGTAMTGRTVVNHTPKARSEPAATPTSVPRMVTRSDSPRSHVRMERRVWPSARS